MSEPDTEHAAGPITPQTPVVSNYGLVLTVYILYLVGFLAGITVLVGLVIAYLQRDNTDRLSQSHFQFQISTFWIGLLYFFYWDFNTALFNWRSNFALVGGVDCDSMCERASRIEHG
jgi:uncharacterized membrane protein